MAIRELRQLLESLGIPYIQSPDNYEAEAVCVMLEKLEMVDGVITNDSDAFVYGASSVLKDLKVDAKTVKCELYHLPKVDANSVAERRMSFLLFALICGCDFCDGVPGLGSQAALKIIGLFRAFPGPQLHPVALVARFNNRFKGFLLDYPTRVKNKRLRSLISKLRKVILSPDSNLFRFQADQVF